MSLTHADILELIEDLEENLSDAEILGEYERADMIARQIEDLREAYRI